MRIAVKFFFFSKKNVENEAFWKLLSNERFPKLKKLKAHTFVRAHSLYEATEIEDKKRLEDETLDACLRLSTSGIEAHIDKIIKDK